MNCRGDDPLFPQSAGIDFFVLHQVRERLQALMAVEVAGRSGCARLVVLLSSFLPIDQKRREILRVWVAFLGYAVGQEDLMADHQHSAGELRQVIMQE
jgi:hypothetical protein